MQSRRLAPEPTRRKAPHPYPGSLSAPPPPRQFPGSLWLSPSLRNPQSSPTPTRSPDLSPLRCCSYSVWTPSARCPHLGGARCQKALTIIGWPRSEGARSRAAAGEPEAARNEAAGAPREGLSWRDSCRPHQPAGRIPCRLARSPRRVQQLGKESQSPNACRGQADT